MKVRIESSAWIPTWLLASAAALIAHGVMFYGLAVFSTTPPVVLDQGPESIDLDFLSLPPAPAQQMVEEPEPEPEPVLEPEPAPEPEPEPEPEPVPDPELLAAEKEAELQRQREMEQKQLADERRREEIRERERLKEKEREKKRTAERARKNELARQAALAKRVVAKPSPTRRTPPRYPTSARRAGHEGTTYITATITASGTVSSPRISTSSGHSSLDNAALAAVKRWRFSPARNGLGKAVSYQLRIPVTFQLR